MRERIKATLQDVDDPWFIALNVAPKTKKMQQYAPSAEQVWRVFQLGEGDAGEEKKKNKNALGFPTVAQ